MNSLQKDFHKSTKRKIKQNKKRLDISKKTGRMKVRVRAQAEYQKKLIANKLKQDSNTTSTPMVELSPTSK